MAPFWHGLDMSRTNQTIADRLRLRRLELDLTLMQVAVATGADPSQVSRWEHGRVVPRADALPDLARALRTSVGYLMGETDIAEMDAT